MVRLSEEEKLTLIYELLSKGIGQAELHKLGINIGKLSISTQCKLAKMLLKSGFSKENLEGLGFNMEKFPIQEQIKLNILDARNKNQKSIHRALEENEK